MNRFSRFARFYSSTTHELIVSQHHNGSRLDRFLNAATEKPISLVQKMIRKKFIVLVDERGAKAKLSDPTARVQAGMRLQLPDSLDPAARLEKTERKVLAHDQHQADQMLLYRDENILVINKPSGLASQGGDKVKFSITDLLPALAFGSDQMPKLIHRLDKDTSGAMMLARNLSAARAFHKLWTARETDANTIQKTYLALVHGTPPKESGLIKNFLTRIDVQNGDRIGIADVPHGKAHSVGDQNKIWRAITAYKTVATIGEFSLLALTPKTGRQHQLRVHCASVLQCPIVGDYRYAPNQPRNLALLGNSISTEADMALALHAFRLQFPNPGQLLANGGKSKCKVVTVEAPMAGNLAAICQAFGFKPNNL